MAQTGPQHLHRVFRPEKRVFDPLDIMLYSSMCLKDKNLTYSGPIWSRLVPIKKRKKIWNLKFFHLKNGKNLIFTARPKSASALAGPQLSMIFFKNLVRYWLKTEVIDVTFLFKPRNCNFKILTQRKNSQISQIHKNVLNG